MALTRRKRQDGPIYSNVARLSMLCQTNCLMTSAFDRFRKKCYAFLALWLTVWYIKDAEKPGLMAPIEMYKSKERNSYFHRTRLSLVPTYNQDEILFWLLPAAAVRQDR